MTSALPFSPAIPASVKLGSRVHVSQTDGSTAIGTVRFLGKTKFKPGKWVGVELEENYIGKNDGSIGGVRYFKCCGKMKGIFVRPDHVEAVEEAPKSAKDILKSEKKRGGTPLGSLGDVDEDSYISLFNMQTKAFRYNKDKATWVELAEGKTLFRWITGTEKFWVYMRPPKSEKSKTKANASLDYLVEPSTKVEDSVVSQQSWVFRAVDRCGSGKGKTEPGSKKVVLCLQFQTVHEAKVFVSTFEGCRKSMLKVALHQRHDRDSREETPSKLRRTMRRRLTVSGSDPLLDGHKKGAALEKVNGQPASPREFSKSRSRKAKAGGEDCVQVSAYTGLSQKGVAPYNPDKQNQDSMTMEVLDSPGSDGSNLLLCVYDGHGENGHTVSRYISSRLPEIIAQNPEFNSDEHTGKVLQTGLIKAESELINDFSVDTTLSGTTAVVSVLRNGKLFVANVGDSRVIKGRQKRSGSNKSIQAVDLSVDHKPEMPRERQRIERCGGRVSRITYEDGVEGPPRVFLCFANMPGLAMSRSLCDTVAKEAGVISEAELFVRELDKQDKFVVLASDGLWEFMSSQEVCDIVAKHMDPKPNPQAAIQELVKESNKRWRQEEPVIDDTTVIVAYLE